MSEHELWAQLRRLQERVRHLESLEYIARADTVDGQHASEFAPVAHVSATTGIHGVGTSTVESATGAQSKVDTHAALTAPHSATAAATADRLVLRDAAGRSKVAAPAAADDVARRAEIDAVAQHGTFTVGGANNQFYPVQFENRALGSNATSSRLQIYRPDTHANGSFFGTFNLIVSFHPSVWGNWASGQIEWLLYDTGAGSPFHDPVGDMVDGSTASSQRDLIVWLRGGGTYHWRNLEPTGAWALLNGNSAGGNITDSSGNVRSPISAQSALILAAKDRLYMNAVGLGSAVPLHVSGQVVACYVPLASSLTHVDWDGDAKAIGTYTLTPAMFGYPASARAVAVSTNATWSSAADANRLITLNPNNQWPTVCTATVANIRAAASGIVTCDGAGAFRAAVHGAPTVTTWVEIVGYFL